HLDPLNQLVISVNYSAGTPHNLELVHVNGTRTRYSSLAGVQSEVLIAAARDSGNGLSLGGFIPGTIFTGNNTPGKIVKISPDGLTVTENWANLPSETGFLGEGVHVDETGGMGGDLLVATTTGGIWRITSAGTPTFIARVKDTDVNHVLQNVQ